MSRLVTSAFPWKSSSRMRIVSTVTLYDMFVSGCPTGSDYVATLFQSFRRTNQQFCLASCSQVELVWHVCLAILVPDIVHRWWVIFLLYVCIWKKAFFHYVTGHRSRKIGVCIWLVEAGKSFLGFVRYWILCFLVRNIIVLSVTPIISISVLLDFCCIYLFTFQSQQSNSTKIIWNKNAKRDEISKTARNKF